MSKGKIKYTKEFLEKVKNGDNNATTLLYEDAKDIAYNKAYSILNNHYDAEDIAEDSVLRAIEKIDTIKKPSEFPAWIRRIAENKAKDYIKKDKPTYMGENFEYTTNDLNSDQKVLPEKMADSQENIDLYKKLISKLTDDQKNALVLNRIEGYKTREIAEMLGCSENTIKSRIHQGEKKLVKEAENLKKKGYTLNGMMPLDFFTVMSKSLGVTSTNVASVVGATTTKSLSLKAMISIVTAILLAFSGLLGTNLLYGVNTPQQLQSPHTTSTSSTMPTFSSQASSTNEVAPTTAVTSAPEKVTTMVPTTVSQNQHNIANQIFSVGNNSFYQDEKITPNTVYQGNTTPLSTISKNSKFVYGELTKDDMNYIRTLVAYISNFENIPNTMPVPTDMYNILMNEVVQLTSIINHFYPNEKGLLTLSEVKDMDDLKKYKVSINDIRKVLEETFGTSMPIDYSNKDIKNGYLYFNVYDSSYNYYDSSWYIDSVKYNYNKSAITVIYTNGNFSWNGKIVYKVVLKRNYNNKKFPFMLISNTIQEELTNNIKSYRGSIVDFGDYTIKIPETWAYKKINNDCVEFYEPMTRKKCEKGLLMKIYTCSEIDSLKIEYLLGENYDNSKYYMYSPTLGYQYYIEKGKITPSKKWKKVYDDVYDLGYSVLKSFKLKNKR